MKIIAFMSKWSRRKNLERLMEKYPTIPNNLMRIFFDLSKPIPENKSQDVEELTEEQGNRVIYKDEFEKFNSNENIEQDLLYEDAGPAWDVYLFYGKDALWTDGPPEPAEWMHQLGGSRRADPGKFRPGAQLTVSLKEATARILQGKPPAGDASAKAPDKTTVRFEGIVLRVEGMTCQGCANTVQTALAAVPGVETARVDFAAGLAWVTPEVPNAVGTGTLIKAVEKCGFKAALPRGNEILSIPADLDVQILSIPGCPNAAAMRANLAEALAALGAACPVREIDLQKLAKDDRRLCFGSPTVLVNGNDLLGQPATDSRVLSCRIYSGGAVPSVQEIRRNLLSYCRDTGQD